MTRLLLAALAALPGAAAAQDLVAYDCDFGTHIEVMELPRDTLVLWWDDEPAVALTALPTGGHGLLWGTDGLDWRQLDDGMAELTLHPESAETEPHAMPQTERCARAAP